ncbi:histidine acid phosphatase family protein [Prunus dulcis]|uniref:Multiple inositol polyphosphate phosphatase 1 n=1 Tax=Prunus dulcis TaxID=3755 RepID=A0A4Y1RLQ5_PRUDU|nr:histidine acid phosphatase family protein [Prunus dulcis]
MERGKSQSYLTQKIQMKKPRCRIATSRKIKFEQPKCSSSSEVTETGKMKPAMATILLVLLSLFIHSNGKEKAFDVRQHLSIVSRYSVVEDIADSSFVPSKIPDGCTPIHLNLVLDNLAAHLEVLLREAEEHNLFLEKLPGWLKGWKSPWKGKLKGGELIIQGEDELYDLEIRTRARFPNLFNDDYHPDVYAIKATHVPRASASAVAFGIGLFSGKGSLGPGRHRAFAVPGESCASDTMLRFYDCCQNYKLLVDEDLSMHAFKKSQEPPVDKLKEPVYDEITSAVRGRHRLNLTRKDITSLWFLCKQEASLLNIVDQACALFSPSEWTDDLEAFILKGYGKSINYRMGVPLLEDVVQSMEQAIKAEEEKHAPGSYEKARLRFAHAETVVPFSCLFLTDLNFKKYKGNSSCNSLQSLPRREIGGAILWHLLVGITCWFVQLSSQHIKQALCASCDGIDFCPLDMFKERIVAPHLKHGYNSVCNVKLEQQE